MTEIVKFNQEQIDLVTKTIANGATPDELKLFLYQCERTGLDPFAKQIYSIKRKGRMVTQISIDGARLTAQRSGRYAGQDGPYWCGDDGVWRDVWLEDKNPRAAKVIVFLVGTDRGTPGVALWKEYSAPDNNMWQKMPALMLSKCAEMLALRKAFPMELSGLYAAEEMDQAANEIVVEVQPNQGLKQITHRGPESEINFMEDAPTGTEKATQKASLPRVNQSGLNRLHAIGTSVYGKDWDETRPVLVENITCGAETSSKELTPGEANELMLTILGNAAFGIDWPTKADQVCLNASVSLLRELKQADVNKLIKRLEDALKEKAAGQPVAVGK